MTSISPLNTPRGDGVSPRQSPIPKSVAFELLFVDAPQYRARLPMRVHIYPHDTTDSIVTTVKNFYGLYSGPTGSKGVSFEDKDGNTLIARYENFTNNMVVYVRVFEEYPAESSAYPGHSYPASAPGGQTYYNGEGFNAQSERPDNSRPASRASRSRSRSPNAIKAFREDSAGVPGHKHLSRPIKSQNGLSNGDAYDDHMAGYSSDEGARSTTSARTKEQLGNTDISVENIVEGGRRKRAKFESSELPLFAPPQMPAATSNPSVSPARRIEHQRPSMPFGYAGPNPFTNPRPIPSTYNHTNGMQSSIYTPHNAGHGRSRSMAALPTTGTLPTPDPTVGSCVSEEDKDVALQLMRLGDMSNISHGRTSASTLDDTFSGKADAASSTGATSDSESDAEDELPAPRRQKLDATGASRGVFQTTTEAQFAPPPGTEANGDTPALQNGQAPPLKNKAMPKPKSTSSKLKAPKVPKVQSPSKKLPPVPAGPMSPASAPGSRKQSIASATGLPGQPGEDDSPDLSSKPRCQRCRKSKKGCDRQRPCGRCRDAGLTAEQCISEDEGNGRKGRYGRHMGVPIKKEGEAAAMEQPALLPAAPILPPPPMMMAADKAKKRKR